MPGKKGNKAHANKTSFKPGTVANPGGRPKLPEDVKEARKLNQIELERTVNRFLFAPLNELAKTILDPETLAMDALVAALITRAVESGDPARFELILNRLIGKVTDKVDVKIQPFVVEKLDGSKLEMGARKIEEGA